MVPLSPPGESLDGSGKLAPTLVFNPGEATRLMQDEIFGPILPVLTYRSLDQAIAFVNARRGHWRCITSNATNSVSSR